MKGLIIKDVMCLKKQLMLFIYVMAGVVIISVMYVLSARYGNLADMGRGMVQENELTSDDVRNMGTMALVLFMLLPIATIADMANVFAADGKAGFYRIAGTFPISLRKRLLARYLSIYALLFLGTAVDILLAFVLSVLTDLITFLDFLGIILSVASIMGIYSAPVIFFCILLGYGKEQYALLLSLILIVAAVVLKNCKAIGTFFLTDFSAGGTLDFSPWGMLDFIKEKAWILVLIAAGVSILSYGAAYLVAERKRGVI